MIRPPLITLRTSIEDLADPAGPYVVVSARTGDPPVPVDGLRFPTRETARRAACLTEAYRSSLRRYDPEFAHCDPIVLEDPELQVVCCRGDADRRSTRWSLRDPVLDGSHGED